MAWSKLGIMLTGNGPHSANSKHLETRNRSKLLYCGFIFPRVAFTSDLLGTLLQSQGTSSLRGLQDKVGETMWNKVAAIFSHYNLAGAVFEGKFSRGVLWSFHVAIVIVYTLVHQDVWQGAGNTSRARLKTKNGGVQKPCCLLPGATCETGISLGQRGGIGFNPRISCFSKRGVYCIYSWYSKARNEALRVVWNNDNWSTLQFPVTVSHIYTCLKMYVMMI